jgi:hypothetical protein
LESKGYDIGSLACDSYWVYFRSHTPRHISKASKWEVWFWSDCKTLIHMMNKQRQKIVSKWKYNCFFWITVSFLRFRSQRIILFVVSFESRSGRVVPYTTLCDNVCQWLATGRWFSQGTPIENWPPRYNWNIVESGVKHHELT